VSSGPAASRSSAPPPEDRDGVGDTGVRLGDALQRAGDPMTASEVYLSAAHAGAGTPTAQRALLGAVRSLVAGGDRLFAEAVYRRLVELRDADPAIVAEAKKTLGAAR
jgi:hypothetical protein